MDFGFAPSGENELSHDCHTQEGEQRNPHGTHQVEMRDQMVLAKRFKTAAIAVTDAVHKNLPREIH